MSPNDDEPGFPPDHGTSNLGWWTISGEALVDAMRRCAAGEDPDAAYVELYANSEVAKPEADPDEGGE